MGCSNQGARINLARDPYEAEIEATLFALRTTDNLSTNEYVVIERDALNVIKSLKR